MIEALAVEQQVTLLKRHAKPDLIKVIESFIQTASHGPTRISNSATRQITHHIEKITVEYLASILTTAGQG